VLAELGDRRREARHRERASEREREEEQQRALERSGDDHRQH
jgi:hypothetical protein